MVRLHAIGECTIEVDSVRIGTDAEMAFALLLVFVLAQGRPVGRAWLVELLWPATSEAKARHNLRQTLYKLRQLGVPVETYGHQLRLPSEELEHDPLLSGEIAGLVTSELLHPDIHFGEFLAGYEPDISGSFANWLEEQRSHMNARLRRALLTIMADERRRGNWGAVETLARKCLRLDPLNEEAILALAEATALTGSKRAALDILDSYLAELGDTGEAEVQLRLPASVLRRRIAERLRPSSSLAIAESCFVGRGDGMAYLHDRFAQVRGGKGCAILLWGEAGIGKSRLAAEFSRQGELDGARTARVVCQPRDQERPLSVFMDLVPLLLDLPGALGCSQASMEYLHRLTDHDPELTEPTPATREAEALFAGIRHAILDLVDAVAEESPLVLCVEDAHWVDEQSWRVLRELIEWSEARRVLVLLTSRQPHPMETPPARMPALLETYRVTPLAWVETTLIFEAVTRGNEAPPTFRDWCIHVAAGNPFFIRALALHWLETGELQAPTSLAMLIDQRVERLPAMPLRILQACAVLGRTSTFERLEAVLEHRRHELVDGVGRLSEHGLVAVDGASVPCRHDLIVQSALRCMAAPARRLLHRCAAVVLQADVERSQSATLLWDCAQQWQEAGERDSALSLIRSCAGHLLEIGLPAEAAEIYERALELCETDEERLEMLDNLCLSLRNAGSWERLCTLIPDVQVLRAKVKPWESRHNKTQLLLLEAQWRTNHPLPDLLARAVAFSEERNAALDNRLAATALALVFADNLCDADAATRLHEWSQALRVDKKNSTISLLRTEMIFHNAYGSISRAVESAEALIAHLRTNGSPILLASALRNATTPYRTAGRFDDAFACAIEAYELATSHGMASAAANAADILATLNLLLDDVENATEWYQQACYWASIAREIASDISIRRVGVRIALAHDNAIGALELLQADSESLAADQVSRRRTEGYALFTACSVAAGLAVDSDILSAFSHSLSVTMPFGGQDFAVNALRSAYLANSQISAAEELTALYAMSRREMSPMPPWLQIPGTVQASTDALRTDS